LAVKLQLNFKSSKPVYLQIVDQVKAAVASGAARAGDPLPSIRPLAEELRVNRNTVAKAYLELERQGAIETSAGRGCFVRGAGVAYTKDARLKLLSGQLDEVVVQAHHLQVSRADLLRLVEQRYDAFERQRTARGVTA
jgi:GntR family transcriptional regulator